MARLLAPRKGTGATIGADGPVRQGRTPHAAGVVCSSRWLRCASTSGPLLHHLYHLAGIRVRDPVTTEPAPAWTDWPLSQALRCVVAAGANRLPVVDAAGAPIGILTPDDVLAAPARRLPAGRPAARSVR